MFAKWQRQLWTIINGLLKPTYMEKIVSDISKPSPCDTCENFSTCTRLCEKAEKWVNQGFRRQREITNREDYINGVVNTDDASAFDYVDIQSKKALYATIIKLHREGKTLSEILYYVGGNGFLVLDRSRISKIIKKWYALGKPSDLSRYYGRLKN